MQERSALLYLLVAALAPASVLSQTPPASETTSPPQTTAPPIKVESRVVLVDVVVTNRKGETIPGLRPQDFQIAEDGRPQAISAFEEHKRGTSARVEVAPLPPNVYTNLQPVKSSDSVNIFLIDLLNTQPWFQKGVCTQAIKYLKTVPRGTRLAIFTLSTQQLRLVRGLMNI